MFSLEIANQVVQRCKLPEVVLVSALYGLGQLSSCTMNIIVAIQTKWRKGFPGTNQVVHQTNQVVRTTLKRPSENTGLHCVNCTH